MGIPDATQPRYDCLERSLRQHSSDAVEVLVANPCRDQRIGHPAAIIDAVRLEPTE